MPQGLFTDGATARHFALAGNARLTFVSERTGARFTFRVRQGKDDNSPHFVAVLSGPENDSDYTFLGTIFGDGSYRHGRKSSISPEAPSAKAFAWVWRYLDRGELPPGAQTWHEGRCGRCGRTLTVPSSIEAGIGPECATKGLGGYDDFSGAYEDDGDDDYLRSMFANKGSALRVATRGNPRNLPCPNCRRPNLLTPADRARGYQCDACADRAEGGGY